MQLVEVAPRLATLPQLLGRPYSLEDEEEQEIAAAAAAGEDPMDAEGPGTAEGAGAVNAAGASGSGHYTTEQLLQRVQVGAVCCVTLR